MYNIFLEKKKYYLKYVSKSIDYKPKTGSSVAASGVYSDITSKLTNNANKTVIPNAIFSPVITILIIKR